MVSLLLRTLCGRCSFRLLWAYNTFTAERSFTEIWSHWMYFLLKTIQRKLEIWGQLESWTKTAQCRTTCKRTSALHIILRPNYGKTQNTPRSQTSGHLGFCFTRLSLYNTPFKLMTWSSLKRKFLLKTIQSCRSQSTKFGLASFKNALTKNLKTDPLLRK